MIDWTGPETVLFATDAPLPTFWVSMKDWVKAIKEPETDIEFTKEELDLVMGKAAHAVFGD